MPFAAPRVHTGLVPFPPWAALTFGAAAALGGAFSSLFGLAARARSAATASCLALIFASSAAFASASCLAFAFFVAASASAFWFAFVFAAALSVTACAAARFAAEGLETVPAGRGCVGVFGSSVSSLGRPGCGGLPRGAPPAASSSPPADTGGGGGATRASLRTPGHATTVIYVARALAG